MEVSILDTLCTAILLNLTLVSLYIYIYIYIYILSLIEL